MAGLVRTARRAFIDRVMQSPTGLDRVVYRLKDRSVEKPARYIKVVFDLDWPTGQTGEIDQYLASSGVGDALHRVKGLIERTLLEEVEIYDIVVGCVAVRYLVPQSVSSTLVSVAMKKLWINRELYFVTGVYGHLNGRAVQAA